MAAALVVALVLQALKFQGPSLRWWLADFGPELLKATPILFFGFSCYFLGGWGLVNLRELLREKDSKLRCFGVNLRAA